MDGTPIFDELRELFAKSHDLTGTSRTFGSDPRAEAKPSSSEAMRPPEAGRSSEAGRAPAKIIVAGGRGVGKTTFVSSVSEIPVGNVEGGTDFGRITFYPDLVLYLFGMSVPPQSGFGALGAVVLVDARRIVDAFGAINYFENSSVPFIVVVNRFGGRLHHALDEIYDALALAPDVPLTSCDARDPRSTAKALQELVRHTMKRGFSDHPLPPEFPSRDP